jgi:hypothetical protein
VLLTPVPKVLAIINLLLLPVTTVLAEDGLYLGCGVNQIQNKHAAILVPAFFYALQHCFIPTLPDGKVYGLSVCRHPAVYAPALLVLLPQTQSVARHGRSLSY